MTDRLPRAIAYPIIGALSLGLWLLVACAAQAQTVVSQIHNAPGWLPNHAYAPATGPQTRVNSGPGWNGTAWVPYQPLAAYQLTADQSQ